LRYFPSKSAYSAGCLPARQFKISFSMILALATAGILTEKAQEARSFMGGRNAPDDG
jgi:hypothetical protein